MERAKRAPGRCRADRSGSGTRRHHLGSNVVKGIINIITKNAKDTRGAVTTTSANQGKQQGTSVYSMSSCLWGKWLLQLSKTTE